MNDASVHIQLLKGFDDPLIGADVWNALLHHGGSNTIFQTYQYQKTWWEIFGRGRLLLIAACKNNQPFAIAPLFEDGQMIFFIGSGGSDYLDFVGDLNDELVLAGLLQSAKEQVPGFLGFRFYHVPESAKTHRVISALAKENEWDIYQGETWPCPQLSLKGAEGAYAATRKKSLLRHHAWFERNGGFETIHFTQAEDIIPLLNEFFDQHVERWAATDYPSLFQDPMQRNFYTALTEALSPTGWLRFTCIRWREQYIAIHFGFSYEGSFLWYKPSFSLALAKHSPGEVLLRQLILLALDEQAHTFDFGMGEEAFKMRFATQVPQVINTDLYPLSIPANA